VPELLDPYNEIIHCEVLLQKETEIEGCEITRTERSHNCKLEPDVPADQTIPSLIPPENLPNLPQLET